MISHTGSSDGCYESLAVLDDRNSVIDHNVIQPGTGEAGPIGQIDLGGKSSEGAGSGTIIRDNTLSSIDNGNGGLNATFSEDHNLCIQSCTTNGDQGSGTGDIIAKPTFVGGSAPTGLTDSPSLPGLRGSVPRPTARTWASSSQPADNSGRVRDALGGRRPRFPRGRRRTHKAIGVIELG